jgi:hypothetical protein
MLVFNGLFLHESQEATAMIKNPRTRRILSLGLLILGGVILLLAPANVWAGAILVALAIALEIVGAVLGHRK